MKHACLFTTVLLTALGAPLVSSAQAQSLGAQALPVPGAAVFTQNRSASQAFAPRPSTQITLDYEVWDQLLKDFVLYSGPSLRRRERRPQPAVGTRFTHGHTSPFRLEGNRILFENFSHEYEGAVADYAADLIRIGNQIDIPSLPRNEQLAYWINLHNTLAINTIIEDYPVSTPSKIKGPNGESFHDITVATIDGQPLSLRAIREDIVYRHWNDPMVIYGFFHGDIGSPSIQRSAYTGRRVNSILKTSAQEFASSLRGVETINETPRVSRHYQDAAPYFFPDFENDLRAHLRDIMTEEALSALNQSKNPIKVADYDDTIADLTAGDGNRRSFSYVESISGPEGARQAGGLLRRQLEEYREKFEEIRARGLMGTVVIEDIETEPRAIESGQASTSSETNE